ncbi:MAG TPA: ATP-binding cassette domain-containing protein [Clostridiales bacterium]|nr:ATP-binding cassette domain-containing protein [Clostridiales bacterium]
MALIEVKNLSKEYKVVKKKSGLRGAFAGLLHRETTIVNAVNDISFSIDKGEIVGYIGPNGAGKSTTIKMMSGILAPTKGSILINGISPQKDRQQVVKNLGVVFGQRSQLYWDLRLGESFELLKRIYQIPDETYKSNLAVMNEILKINEIIDTPVRQLSLGQRMRGDLAAAILHSPPILFLDEPTIGLDVEVKYAIRKFIRDINLKFQTTIILTTHDLDDIQQLCDRIIIINHGRIVEDGSLHELIKRISPYRQLVLEFYDEVPEIKHEKAKVIKQEISRVWLQFDNTKITAADLISDLSVNYTFKDLSLEEPNIDEIIREVYSKT